MSEETKQEIAEMVETLQCLSRDDLMKTYGFAIGLNANESAKNGSKSN